MDYNDSSFSGLMFNVFRVPEKSDILKTFPSLNRYKEFSAEMSLDRNIVLRYIIYMYDQRTPLRAIDNIFKRKNEAAILAKFPEDKKNPFKKEYEDVILNKNQVVNRMIIRFVRIQKNPSFSQLVSYEEAFYNQLEKLRTDDREDQEKTKDLIGNTNQLRKNIDELTADLLSGDENRNLQEELYTQIEYEQLGLSPEDIALKAQNGEDPLCGYNPYL